ncbi:acid ceramidase-like [Oratosquilla oratoria]|uniref:acid ceramidase-like n=1 Tax=Oratosquilla oratoria TaxID=337810 RepID=UPI003F76C582
MANMRIVLCCLLILRVTSAVPSIIDIKKGIVPFEGCEGTAYPPKEPDTVPTYTINLDDSPFDRWNHIMKDKKTQMHDLIADVRSLMKILMGEKVFNIINSSLPKLAETLPSPFYEEMHSISSATDLPLSEVTLYNIFYEVFTLCTSIVAQDKHGRMYHGRNLDFGLFMGWDLKNHTWRVAELLKPLVIHLDWQRANKTVFQSVNYAGFVGVLTGVKKDKFTFSLDERFGFNGGFVGLLEWILFHDHKQQWVGFFSREVLERAQSYEEAKDLLSKKRLLAPVYFILGGVNAGEGCIITRDRENFNILSLGSRKSGSGSWFLVETNYDHWKNPPFFDDRRTPAIKCMMEGGQEEATEKLLYNVLSTKPVFNKLTTYTSLMQAGDGKINTWLRNCPDPCWPW